MDGVDQFEMGVDFHCKIDFAAAHKFLGGSRGNAVAGKHCAESVAEVMDIDGLAAGVYFFDTGGE